MRSIPIARLALLATILMAFGCSSNNKGKIEGTKWTSVATTMKGQPIPEGMLKLEFGADGKLVYRVMGQALTGTYSLGMGDHVTLNMDQDLAGRKSHVEKVSINGDPRAATGRGNGNREPSDCSREHAPVAGPRCSAG